MTNPASDPSPQRFRLMRSLFGRAQALPLAQREAFVRAQAGDASIADEVLSLLRGTEAQVTAWLANGAARDMRANERGDSTPSSATR